MSSNANRLKFVILSEYSGRADGVETEVELVGEVELDPGQAGFFAGITMYEHGNPIYEMMDERRYNHLNIEVEYPDDTNEVEFCLCDWGDGSKDDAKKLFLEYARELAEYAGDGAKLKVV